jgi:hypothetical protein
MLISIDIIEYVTDTLFSKLSIANKTPLTCIVNVDPWFKSQSTVSCITNVDMMASIFSWLMFSTLVYYAIKGCRN